MRHPVCSQTICLQIHLQVHLQIRSQIQSQIFVHFAKPGWMGGWEKLGIRLNSAGWGWQLAELGNKA